MSGTTRDAQLVVSAPAKINLFLELLAKRPDGFHGIQTVMTTLTLHDTLFFALRPSVPTIEFRSEWALGLQARDGTSSLFGEVPQNDSNLVVRALHLLRQETGTDHGAVVRLVKRIPSGAGLGGGSSDAAAALIAGNLGWRLGLKTSHLMDLATQLGSDVPFFLGTAIALCTGRGERLTALPRIPSLETVLVRPPESLGTADVYRHSKVPEFPRKIPSPFLDGTIRSARDLQDGLFNRLQDTAAEMSESILRLHHEFSRAAVVAHQMSGSGSTYFGICQSGQDAKRVQQQLRAANLGHVLRAKTGSMIGVYRAGNSTN